MSRVGNKAIPMPSGVNLAISGSRVDVSGPLGKLSWEVPRTIRVGQSEDKSQVMVSRESDEKSSRALHGLSRALIANMVCGVSQGFERRLHIYGTGFGCNVVGQNLEMNVGFMGRGSKGVAQFRIPIPPGVTVVVEVPSARGDSEPAKMLIKGCDKQQVGQFAAMIRKIRPPEPYKGKGIRYDDEQVRRKQGKAVAGSGG